MTAMAKKNKTNNKHFSKCQKEKQRHTKTEKKEFKPTGKRGRLIIRNLPFKCNENDLHAHFKPFGEIRDIQLLRRPDKKLVGCGFVEYSSRLNADKAVEQLNGKQFLGRPIYIERAVAQERYKDTATESEDVPSTEDFKEEQDLNEEEEYMKKEIKIKEECKSFKDQGQPCYSEFKQETMSSDEEMKIKKTHDKRKNVNLKQARLIIRNLSFKTTEAKLKAHFAEFGEITEVKLLRRPNNTLIGCGFVQFAKKQAAAKAIYHTSGKPFLERPIIVDWAVAKDKFKQMQKEALNKEIKIEVDEDIDAVNSSNVTVKKEEQLDRESDENSSESSDSMTEEEEEDDENSDFEDEDIKQNIKEHVEGKRKRKEDVDEGKTVFVKNLPFSTTDEEFRECMEQFGPVFYAVICKDKFTEHSRGSGFVKFKEKDDAEKCLSAGTELTLKGNVLDPHPALKRSDIQNLKDKPKEKKDNRNLYLTKEGMIIAGTPAAQGVSVSDMERRLQLEQWKTTKLRNLNMFVSRNRLVIHNLPPAFTDKQLRKLFQSHAGPTAIIRETRIMRNLKHVDSKGMSISKGFGFVSFERHEDALKALRSINNNPSIFTPTMRPIVAFSIENRSVLNTKSKRMIRSQQKNPLCKEYNPTKEEIPAKKAKQIDLKHEEQSESQFAGIVAKPGSTVKMRQKYKLQNQAQQHVQDVRKQNREKKMSRQLRRVEHIKNKQAEKKTVKKNKLMIDNDSAFTKLVDKYKSKLMPHTSEKKKWYET